MVLHRSQLLPKILSQANHDFDIDGFLALIATEVDIMVEQPTLDEILSHSNKLHFSVPKVSDYLYFYA